MRLINLNCVDSESFKYSMQLYLYYYNIKSNHARVSQLNNNLNLYIHIKFNKNLIERNLKNITLILIYLLSILIVSLYS